MATYIFTESQIKKILNELKEARDTYYRMLDKKAPFFINEGLIKTYPTKTVIDVLANLFHLKKRDFRGIDISGTRYIGEIWQKEWENGEELISVIVPKDEPLLDSLEKYFHKYGWIKILTNDIGDGMIEVDFEKRFSGVINADTLLVWGANKIYHIAPLSLKSRILRNGLVPNSSKALINSPDRLYLFVNEPEKHEIATWALSYIEPKHLPGNTGVCLCSVDLQDIDKNLQFYFDPRMANAFYSLEPISPEVVHIEQEFSFDELREIKF